jgi:hypothetical protein
MNFGTITTLGIFTNNGTIFNNDTITGTITGAEPVGPFVYVTGITGLPTTATAGTPLALTGTVAPSDASFQTITWRVDDAGTTGARINSGNSYTLSTTAAGTADIIAIITYGAEYADTFTYKFRITVTPAAEDNGNVNVIGNDMWHEGPQQPHPTAQNVPHDVPQTGITGRMVLPIVLALLGIALITGGGIYRFRKVRHKTK